MPGLVAGTQDSRSFQKLTGCGPDMRPGDLVVGCGMAMWPDFGWLVVRQGRSGVFDRITTWLLMENGKILKWADSDEQKFVFLRRES